MTLRLSTVRKWIVYLLVVYVFFYPHITVMLGGVALYPILFTIIGLSLLTILHGNRHGIRMSLLSTCLLYTSNDGAQSMVMSTINKLKNGEVPQFTKGEQMWDYLYSGDAAEAFRLLGEKGHNRKVYVLGSGKARPLAEYIKEIRDTVNPNAEIALGAIPYGEKQVMHLQADITELQNDIGFCPQMEFSMGIRTLMR